MSRRGWIIIGVVVGVWMLLLVGLGVVAVASLGSFVGGGGDWAEDVVEGKGDQKVALIRVSGEITGGAAEGLTGSGAGARDIIDQLDQAEEDDAVAAIVLRLETPGGEVVASDDVYRELRRVGKKKPIVSSMGDLAASGGYYLAAATQRIVASPSSLTGSIGVIAVLPNLEEAAGKLGVKAVVIKSGAFKDAGSPLRGLRPEEQAYFQRLIDEAYEQFLKAVSDGRGKSVEQVRPLADGRVYSGIQAKANGLVDELGDLDAAYDAALRLADLDRDAASLVEYEQPASLGSLLTPAFRSPVEEAKRELGVRFGLKYLFLAGA